MGVSFKRIYIAVFICLIIYLSTFILEGCSSNQINSNVIIDNEVNSTINEINFLGETKKSALFIIAQDKFRDDELEIPYLALKDAGIDVKVASITNEMSKGMLGKEIIPDLIVKEVKIQDYDAIIIVGGSGAPELADHIEVISLLNNAKNSNKIIAAICFGPVVLAKAGILENKRATVFATDDSQKALIEGGAHLIRQNVVRDDNIITANGPSASEQFANELLIALT
ncbi:DJ-1/PfpI family protein [Nanoarchaeota archaeon]